MKIDNGNDVIIKKVRHQPGWVGYSAKSDHCIKTIDLLFEYNGHFLLNQKKYVISRGGNRENLPVLSDIMSYQP